MIIKTLKYINLITLVLFIFSALTFIISINLLNLTIGAYISFIFHIILALTGYFISLYFLFRYKKNLTAPEAINVNNETITGLEQKPSETIENETLNMSVKEFISQYDNNKPIENFADEILSRIAKQFEIVQGLLYTRKKGINKFVLTGKYAFYSDKGTEEIEEFIEGEGITGRVAIKKETLITDQVPEKNITILSGLGSGPPRYMAVVPILYSGECLGIIQLFSFHPFAQSLSASFIETANLIGEKIHAYLEYNG